MFSAKKWKKSGIIDTNRNIITNLNEARISSKYENFEYVF